MKNSSITAVLPVVLMMGCEQSDLSQGALEGNLPSQELQGFIQKVKSNLVFVEGGEFLMGDYGVQYGPERLPYDSDKDSKPLHKVELSNYSINKYKITNEEFLFYLKSRGLELRQDVGDDFKAISTMPTTPAHMDWVEAEQYCNWLKNISDVPFGLPTEAQWEYAARSRGQFLMVATDDGTYKATDDEVTEDWKDGPKGINISSSWDRKIFAKEMGWKTGTFTPLPVDRFPPNPLGLYSMSDNGYEWVKDWYDPNYYQYSSLKDPQGPSEPVYKDARSNHKYAKVLRGKDFADPSWGGGVNVHRSYKSPDGTQPSVVTGMGDLLILKNKTARCVVNHPQPIK
ncbi:formylglycine-generating enzyme family protein [Pseudomonas sp. IT-P218]|jgi:formylglycine-generating enzyme required for sulfatase activity|uniref:formylglycine-generating enzyme family protein n=1 Tax=Pseudomonas sp. IT-P218 TaxID=3026449 RepID=UPI0039E03F14